ncbi:UBP-type zinc finger domain-containing protein [Streptomyces sp. NPDC005803]|uniref:UBP-type zinc finger domain-containing protein n=1 Tax=Streptomyces sp. NPDC005803 TaxID=3154297 RepID=UPI0033DDD169
MADQAIPGIDPQAAPSGPGCADCLAGDGPGWWFHLRRCAACGRIGCCDSSPSQHATKHFQSTGHPYMPQDSVLEFARVEAPAVDGDGRCTWCRLRPGQPPALAGNWCTAATQDRRPGRWSRQ